MPLPGAVLFNPRWIAWDANGAQLPGALLESFTTGGTFSTPKSLYADSGLNTALANPVVADAAGRFAEMFMDVGGYDLRLKDAAGNIIYTAIDVEDIGQTFLDELGETFTDGAKDVSSGYTVIATDNLITLDAGEATNPAIINLPAATARTGPPVGIKNLAPVTLNITPNGSDTIEGVAAAFSIAVGASPAFPTVWLASDGVSNWWILSSHAL